MIVRYFIFVLIGFLGHSVTGVTLPSSPRAEKSIEQVRPSLTKTLHERGLQYGAPVFIRVFKDPGLLELWVESASKKFELFKTYDICSFSGELGPKVRQGDNQAPEGFYYVNPDRLNPWSRFHLSFNLGYPNTYDRYHGRTGDYLMIHGDCVSIGCYAMTNTYMNEIYALTAAALEQGQPFVRVHIFPFMLEQERLQTYASHEWYGFWLNLKEGYEYFNLNNVPPNVEVSNGRYVFNSAVDD